MRALVGSRDDSRGQGMQARDLCLGKRQLCLEASHLEDTGGKDFNKYCEKQQRHIGGFKRCDPLEAV